MPPDRNLSPSDSYSRFSHSASVTTESTQHTSRRTTAQSSPSLNAQQSENSGRAPASDPRRNPYNPSRPALPHKYTPPQYQQPSDRLDDIRLIDYVTNEWKNCDTDVLKDSYETDDYGQFIMTDRPKQKPTRLLTKLGYPWRVPLGRRPLRWIVVYVVCMITVLALWTQKARIKPIIFDDEELLDNSMDRAKFDGKTFGSNVKPEFTDMVHIKYLPHELVPGASGGSRKRLIILGDVHGAKREMLELLATIKFNRETDHLIFAGDMIVKGPASLEIIDYARGIGASCVRGNHEDRVLLAYASLHPKKNSVEGDAKTPATGAEAAMDHNDKHFVLARQLSEEQAAWLKQCPVILNIGQIADKDYVVVHAGLAPGIRLEMQDPYHVMNMRTIDLETRVPSALRKGEPWEKVWNHFQSHLPNGMQRKTAIYGHDAPRGLRIKSHSRGLDSGCVRGGKLTALIIDEHGKERTESVRCHNYVKAAKDREKSKSPPA